jgi:hypothetical protein
MGGRAVRACVCAWKGVHGIEDGGGSAGVCVHGRVCTALRQWSKEKVRVEGGRVCVCLEKGVHGIETVVEGETEG